MSKGYARFPAAFQACLASAHSSLCVMLRASRLALVHARTSPATTHISVYSGSIPSASRTAHPNPKERRCVAQIAGSLIKSAYAAAVGVERENVYHASLMPCYDKKLEVCAHATLGVGRAALGGRAATVC
eukprot:6181910-Pleurochrysis_carterae.AAC.4